MALDVVAVAPAVALLHHISGLGEISDDRIRGALGDVERGRDIAQPSVRLVSEEQHRQRVRGEKGPITHGQKRSSILEFFC